MKIKVDTKRNLRFESRFPQRQIENPGVRAKGKLILSLQWAVVVELWTNDR